jgi:hypothetical protein
MQLLRSTLVLFGLVCAPAFAAPEVNASKLLNSQPLHFEPASKPGVYVARGLRYQLEFSGTHATLRGTDSSMGLAFDGASSRAALTPTGELPARSTIFHGNDRAKWQGDLPTYRRLQASELYPGIDLVYYGNSGELEYDLNVKPGADPDRIRLKFSGSVPQLDAAGNLSGEFLQKRPVAYQLASDGSHVPVASRYRQNADGSFGFALGAYDRSRELVIDPTLSFSNYVAGSGQDSAKAVGHDKSGLVYIAGNTTSSDLTLEGDSYQPASTGSTDIFIAVFDPKQSDPDNQLVYATYFGGSGAETVGSMVVSPSGTVYIVGSTNSPDLPLQNASQTVQGGGFDAFVLKMIPAQGSAGFYYASFLGGTLDEQGLGIAVNAQEKLVVVGSTKSSDYPIVGAIQSGLGGFQMGFVAIFDPSGSAANTLAYSTYLGGSTLDVARDVAVAADGTLWVVGNTYSADFPVAGNSYAPGYAPGGDAFVVQINPGFSSWPGLLYSSFLGGLSADQANKVRIDSKGRLVIAGDTQSVDFPVTITAMQSNYGGGGDGFVAILDPTIGNSSAQLVYATFFGGSRAEAVNDMKIDANGIVYLTGYTTSPNLSVTLNALQPAYDLNLDAYMLKFDPTVGGVAAILYSSYVGSKGSQTGYGIDFDTTGRIYLAGSASSSLFDALGGTTKPTAAGHTNAFVMRVTP